MCTTPPSGSHSGARFVRQSSGVQANSSVSEPDIPEGGHILNAGVTPRSKVSAIDTYVKWRDSKVNYKHKGLFNVQTSHPRNPFLADLNTVKVDVLGVQDVTAVDGESDTLDLGGTFLGSRLVFDSDLGFLLGEERVVDLTFVVLSLPHQFPFQPDMVRTYAGLDDVKVKCFD